MRAKTGHGAFFVGRARVYSWRWAVSGVRIAMERATVHWNQEDAPLSWFRASVSRFALKQLCGA